MRPIATVVADNVVCVLSTRMRPANTTEPIVRKPVWELGGHSGVGLENRGGDAAN